MGSVVRLVTFVDVRDDLSDAHQMSVSARHEAVLVNGRHVLLLDDRGWSCSLVTSYREGEAPDDDSRREAAPDIWAVTSVEEVEDTARVVVGPDEPYDGRSQEDMDASHWAYLTEVLRRHGVVVDALELKQLPHDIVLGERLLGRIGGDPGDAVS